jgi:hypothetical protein
MNRNIISAVIGGALILSSCVGSLQTNRDSVDIEFRPVIGNDTRAEGSIPFPQDRSFKLWATEDRTGDIYISDASISYNGGWYAPKPWTQEPLRFTAYWPTDLDCIYSEDKGIQIISFDSSDGQTDLLLAEVKADNDAGSQVTMNFQHILSRVGFKMIHSLQESMSVKINKVTLSEIAMVGSYNLTTPHEWTGQTKNETCIVFEDEEGLLINSNEATYLEKEFYAIPQMTSAKLKVECQIHYGQAGSWIPQTYEISPIEIVWDPGKHMIYTLNIRMDKMVHTLGISSMNNR